MRRGSALVTLGFVYAGIGGFFTMFVLEGLFHFRDASAFVLSMLGAFVTFIVYGIVVTIAERIEEKLSVRSPRKAIPFPGYRAWLLLVIALVVSFGVWLIVRWSTPDTLERKARLYWAEIQYHAEETKDVEAQRQLAKQIVEIGPEAYPVVVDIVRKGPYGREVVNWWEVLRSMGSGANDYLSSEIERAARGPRRASRWQSTDSEILCMIAMQIQAFDDWRFFALWLQRSENPNAIDELNLLSMDGLINRKLKGKNFPRLIIDRRLEIPKLNPDFVIWYHAGGSQLLTGTPSETAVPSGQK